MEKKYIRVGKYVGTFGLKGEMKVAVISDFADERFQIGKTLYLKTNSVLIELTIRSVRYHKNQALIAYEGYDDLTALETLPRGDLMVRADQISLVEGPHAFEYKDCEVYDENNQKRGVVLQWEDGAAHGLIRVQTAERQVLIPVVDAFILEKDFDHKRIVVRWMEGL